MKERDFKLLSGRRRKKSKYRLSVDLRKKVLADDFLNMSKYRWNRMNDPVQVWLGQDICFEKADERGEEETGRRVRAGGMYEMRVRMKWSVLWEASGWVNHKATESIMAKLEGVASEIGMARKRENEQAILFSFLIRKEVLLSIRRRRTLSESHC